VQGGNYLKNQENRTQPFFRETLIHQSGGKYLPQNVEKYERELLNFFNLCKSNSRLYFLSVWIRKSYPLNEYKPYTHHKN
jgi:hypothetical protein